MVAHGQAGLAMGYHLAQSRRSFQIADAGAEIGQTWRSRWDSLRLFTSGRYDNLPGLPFPAAPDAYPGKDDVASYLQAYAAKFELPVRLNMSVTSLTRADGGTYVAKTGGEAQVTADSRPGRRLAGWDQVIGPGPRRLARCHGIHLRARAVSAAGRTVTFADGSAAEFDAVVWATGFRTDHSWIDIPDAKDQRGREHVQLPGRAGVATSKARS